MKVHQLFAFLAIMLLGANAPLFAADKKEEAAPVKLVANFTGIT